MDISLQSGSEKSEVKWDHLKQKASSYADNRVKSWVSKSLKNDDKGLEMEEMGEMEGKKKKKSWPAI